MAFGHGFDSRLLHWNGPVFTGLSYIKGEFQTMEEFMRLIGLCRSKKVYIQTHNFPDPDAIASAFGLQALLSYFGIPSTLCYYGKIDKFSTRKMTKLLQIEIFPYTEIEQDMKPSDSIIYVDSQKNGGNILNFVGNEIACIDHHPTYAQEDYLYSDIRIVGSCSTLIAEYYKKLEVPMEETVATALLYGLKMDTVNFTRGVTMLDIEMFQYLFPKADQMKLVELGKNIMGVCDLKAFGSAIESIQVYDRVGIAAIPFACPDALIATVADFILSLEEVEIAIIYAYREKEIKFSVRSEYPSIHAGDLVNRALKGLGNGGGHAEMAGGNIPNRKLAQLGPYPDDAIRDLFLNAIGSAGSGPKALGRTDRKG